DAPGRLGLGADTRGEGTPGRGERPAAAALTLSERIRRRVDRALHDAAHEILVERFPREPSPKEEGADDSRNDLRGVLAARTRSELWDGLGEHCGPRWPVPVERGLCHSRALWYGVDAPPAEPRLRQQLVRSREHRLFRAPHSLIHVVAGRPARAVFVHLGANP